MTTIQFLPEKEFKILKIIQVIGPEWNRFTGYISYLRNFKPDDYGKENEDELDNKILSAIKQPFPNSSLSRTGIYFKGQLEHILQTIEGGTRKNITIQLFPLIPFAQASKWEGKTFNAYAFNFPMRLFLGEDSEKIEYINSFYLCNLSLNGFEEIVKTIHPI